MEETEEEIKPKKSKSDSLKKVMIFSPRMMSMISELKIDKGFLTEADVVRSAISFYYDKMYPGYIKQAADKERMTPEEKAKYKITERKAGVKAEEDNALAEQLEILKALDGTIVTTAHGAKFAKYYNYNRFQRYEQEIPFESLEWALVKNQYYPSREAVDKLVAEGKVKWKKVETKEEKTDEL